MSSSCIKTSQSLDAVQSALQETSRLAHFRQTLLDIFYKSLSKSIHYQLAKRCLELLPGRVVSGSPADDSCIANGQRGIRFNEPWHPLLKASADSFNTLVLDLFNQKIQYCFAQRHSLLRQALQCINQSTLQPRLHMSRDECLQCNRIADADSDILRALLRSYHNFVFGQIYVLELCCRVFHVSVHARYYDQRSRHKQDDIYFSFFFLRSDSVNEAVTG
mmetsp:Transcript_113208/g.196325  ORF Transcript_113208/g.196325 Transcript_113208/m.196325 type:complete len:219 (-) Transcript_113208:391-1047(-)